MKKFLSLLLVLAMFTFALAGCGGGQPDGDVEQPAGDSQGEQPQEQETFKVAMLLAGPISDQGWNATAYNGLMNIEKNLGAEVSYTENIAQSDFEEVFRGYAIQGYNLIFGHGFQFGDAAMKVAPEFPDVKFVITSTNISQEPNVASLNNDNTQQGFLAGALAAMLTEVDKIGVVNGMEIPSIQAFASGFDQGAYYINPDITILSTFTGDFNDAAKAKEVASAMIEEGADIMAHDADAAGLGVVEAAVEKDIPVIGAISDQVDLAPDHMVTSALSDLTKAIEVMAGMIMEGDFAPQMYNFGIAEDTVGLAPYHNFEDKVPQEVKDKMVEIMDDIVAGKIQLEY
jgi:basic membrane protein A